MSSYFAFGVGEPATFAGVELSAFFTSGEEPGLAGEPVGDGLGLTTGLALAAGLGDAAGGFGGAVFGSHALRTAAPAVKTNIINDLLIVLPHIALSGLSNGHGPKPSAGRHPAA